MSQDVKVQVLLSRPIIYNAGDGEMVDAPVKQKQEPVKIRADFSKSKYTVNVTKYQPVK